ncbi:MAG: hypothetical protein ACFE8B_15840 [Candidatus Hermodarchaeota archaeon]
MSNSDWRKINFQQFLNIYNNDLLITNAPTLLYSKKDKEPEAYNSLIAFFFITGGLLIYISITYFLASIYFNLILFIIIGSIATIGSILLLINYIKTNVYIKPLECWLEIYRGKTEDESDYYCFMYYVVFSGRSHPNKAKNVIYKLYQEQVLKSKIDISPIEVYVKLNPNEKKLQEKIGFFFQYGEGNSFKSEAINQASWKFFPFEKSEKENFIAIANWYHQFEWRDDLEYDYDKLHEYAPWVIQKWDKFNLKPINDDFKKEINWNLREIESIPKLKPWEENYEQQIYQNPKANKEETIIEEAILKIIGSESSIEKIRDIKDKLMSIKSYFRDLVPSSSP